MTTLRTNHLPTIYEEKMNSKKYNEMRYKNELQLKIIKLFMIELDKLNLKKEENPYHGMSFDEILQYINTEEE